MKTKTSLTDIVSLLVVPLMTAVPLSATTLPASFDPDAYTAIGTLDLSNGSAITIDTDAGSVSGSASFVSALSITDTEGQQYRAFVFDDISVADGVSITVSGSLGLALLSQDDLSIASDISFSGTDAANAVVAGATGADGSDGGSIAVIAEDYLEVSSILTVSGGAGGRGGSYSDTKEAGAGGDGGDSGSLLIGAPRMQLTATLNARGGEDGDVGQSPEEPSNSAGAAGDGGLILICNDFTTAVTADVSEGSNGAHFDPAPGADGSVVLSATASFLLPTVWYVDADRSGESTQDGVAWSTAFADLQDALALATEGDQVWVADGVYYPDEAEAGVATVTNDSTSSVFELEPGIYLLGGFSGTETELAARDVTTNVTILSGDIDHETNPDITEGDIVVEAAETNIKGSNADTVVYGLRYETGEMRLDGFTITAGYSINFGGGFYGAGYITDCIIQGNYGNNVGGVLPVDGSLLTIVDSSINSNTGLYVGGVYGYNPELQMLRCRIQGNRSVSPDGADAGAARFLTGDVELIDCVISGNYGGGTGGISFPSGNFDGESAFILNGCTVVGNRAYGDFLVDETAGGIDGRAGNRVNLTITNSVIWGNSGVINNNLYGYTTLQNSLVEGLNSGGTNLDGTQASNAPDFLEPILASEAPTRAGGFTVYGNSATVNAGDDLYVDSAYDLNGRNRSIGAAVDLGAFEYDGPITQQSIASFTLNIDSVVNQGARRIFIRNMFSGGYDSLEVEYGTEGVVSSAPDGSFYYLFSGIGEDGEATDVYFYAVNDSNGDRARIQFTITLEDTYTVEDFRADNGMSADGSDDDEDFSGNGISNLMQFVVGVVDANEAEIGVADYDTAQVGLPQYVFDAELDQLTVTYVEPSDESYVGVYSRMRESTTLDSWTAVSFGGESGPVLRSVETDDGYTIYEFTVSMNQDTKFYRLEAEYERGSGEM